MDPVRRPRRVVAALAVPLLLASAPSASEPLPRLAREAPVQRHAPDPPKGRAADLARELVEESSAAGALRHLERFRSIAGSAGGHRSAGSPGHEASAAYVAGLLREAGYRVSYDTFPFTHTETLAEKLSVRSPKPRAVEVSAMTYTASTPVGGIEAPLAVVTPDGTSGCEAADYAPGAFDGRIALIRRGGCSFAEKQAAAADAGAEAAIIHNDTAGPLSGTMGAPGAGRIPTGGVTRAEGRALAAEAARTAEAAKKAGGGRAGKAEVVLSYELRQLRQRRTTGNVLAETRHGAADRTVMLGAHLDSVAEGPGINDNGSGSAGLLEVALELAASGHRPANRIRFAWWSAEELGLLGSEKYVERLGAERRRRIALYLNFDMIASPNHGQFVYDGDDSDREGAGPGPAGSDRIERRISAFLDRRGEPHESTDFSGRSDYGPFVAAGIPSGGTFTGAEGLKTKVQAAVYGGRVGAAYDACYHAPCDTLGNIGLRAFGTNIDVIADAVGTYAHEPVPPRRAADVRAAAGRGRSPALPGAPAGARSGPGPGTSPTAPR